MASSVLTTLGGFAFKVNGVTTQGPATRKARALMAFLAMNRGKDTARDRLLELFWPAADPDNGRASLVTALSSIRSCLRTAGAVAEEFLSANNATVRWTGDTSVDAVRFAELAARERDLSANRAAVRLYDGDFLEGDYDDWSVAERERLSTLYESVLARAVRTSRDADAARLLIVRNPYAEEAYVTLIETELEAGRNASAASLVETFRDKLSEVGERPSEEFAQRFDHFAVRSLEVPPSNLPRQTTSFIARDAELDAVATLLADSQLVTIVGAGGVGKTRVALQAGAKSLHAFEDGVWFADLATVDGEGAVVSEIASSLGVKSSGFGSLLEHVVLTLKRKKLLLVLDNCEHVVTEAAPVIDAILAASPRVTVLATSRERTGARGEQVYRLPSLAVPQGEKLDARTAIEFGAVALFVARATASDAHFSLADDNAGAVVEICRHLDGIALAIELAAARVTTLNVHQLLDRLRREFRLLKGADRTVHPRYQTMRAALDWSYEWLSEAERTLFRHLAIFRGGWTLETIFACGVDKSLDEFAVVDQLWPLVSKSLVVVELRGQSQRYRLMEPLRQYALELLKENGELDPTARQHALCFSELARERGSKWLQIPEFDFVAGVEEEIDNVRAALDWTLVQGNDPVLGAQIAAALGGFWFTQYYHEGLRWLDAAQTAVSYDVQPGLSVDIALHRMRAYGQTDMGETLRIAEEALSSARTMAEELPLVRLEMFRGMALVQAGRFGEADAVLQEALGRAQRADPYRLQYILWGLTKLHRQQGDARTAKDFADRMIKAHANSPLSGDRNRWIILSECARAAYDLDGRLDTAIDVCREALRSTQATNDALGGLQVEYLLGALLFRAGAIDEARAHARRILEMSEDELLPHGVAPALQLLSGVAAHGARSDCAARILGFVRPRLSTAVAKMLVDVDPQWFVAPIRDRLGDDSLTRLMAEGAGWPEDQAIREASTI
jgi:predicted ATPase/DNA-binding SARP family transcriptional activator